VNLHKKKILKYRLQLLFVAFLVIGYASYITLNNIYDKNNTLAFSQLEIAGAKTLPSLKNLLINTQKLRGLTASYKAGDSSLLPKVEQQSAVVKAKLQVAEQAVKKADLKGIAPLFASLSVKVQNAINSTSSQTKEQSFQSYSDVVNEELALIVKIGDMSNLILDPDLDTFYLMDTVINKLPLITESVGKAKAFGSSLLVTKKASKSSKIKLAVLVGSLTDNSALLKSGLSSAYSYNNELKPPINPAFKAFDNSTNLFKNKIVNICQGNFATNSHKFFQNATDVINKAVALYDLNNKHLLRLLNIRVDKMKAAQNKVIVEGIVFFFILIALFYVAYDYLYKNIIAKEAAKKEEAMLKELQKTNSSLLYSLSHDQLTGLYNRGSLMDKISDLENDATLMLIDIKAFKEVNDVYGNDFGNRVLIDFANYLKAFFSTMSEVTLYRIGGDEFAVLMTYKSISDVMKIGKNLEEAIKNQNFSIDDIHINLSVLIAVNATLPLLENADLALKTAKKEMNTQVIEYNSSMNIKKEWQKNIEVINMVKSALAEDRIVPYFQGIVNLQTLKIEKYEALVRLILPSGEVLSPYFFLDTVSKTHYYYEITEVMIRKTMEVAKSYPQQRFSINFSMKDIINENITNTLFKLFDADRETAKRVDIELLETELVIVDDNRISDFITKVHAYGSKVLIDDFGTGYSNFSYLSELDVDILKIDASITKEIVSNPRKLHILRTIHNFTSGMNMQNVAEFVETKEVALLLQKIGVEYAQGYYFSKPLPEPLENSEVSL